MSVQHDSSVEDSFSDIQHIPKLELQHVDFALPPSKSHLIRLLALGALNQEKVVFNLVGKPGKDVFSMVKSLQSLGINVSTRDTDSSVQISIEGGNYQSCSSQQQLSVNCGNSGTTLRIIMGLIASMQQKVTVIGDDSLSVRENESLIKSLIDSGVKIEKIGNNNLPIEITGPIFDGSTKDQNVLLDCSKSSQPLSAWMIASANFHCDVQIELVGKTVSNRHYRLTQELCNQFGASINQDLNKYNIPKWEVQMPQYYNVPGDASMASFAILLSMVQNCPVQVKNWPEQKDALGCEILHEMAPSLGIIWENSVIVGSNDGKYATYDLTDCNDLITPLAAILAISSGGEISGISHTVYKESNRIEKTIELMDCFGLKVSNNQGRLVIDGGQIPVMPKVPVHCHNDHRIFMTAAIIMSKFGGDLIGKGLHAIADESFLHRIGIE